MQQSFLDIHPYLATLIIISALAIYGYITIKILQFIKWLTKSIWFGKEEDK